MKHTAIVLSVITLTVLAFGILWQAPQKKPLTNIKSDNIIWITPTPRPYNFKRYQIPEVPEKSGYSIILVGDSMTAALGPHPSKLSELLNRKYPHKSFSIDNYAEGGANIEKLISLLTLPRMLDGMAVNPALNRLFDIIIIESHGHNPLSHYPLAEGLSLHNQILDELMTEITWNHPQAVVIFVATLSPSPQYYADGTVNIPHDQKPGWVFERQQYIKNHIKYAHDHNIPLVDFYHPHLNQDGTVKMEYIDDDNIHPSEQGSTWIQSQLAEHIIQAGYLK
jgi:hypothetical protein